MAGVHDGGIWSGQTLVASDTALVFAGYFLWKLAVIRNVVPGGTKPDKRGWGSETYWAAASHQLLTALVWFSLLAEHFQAGDMATWASSSWAKDGAGVRRERFIMLSNIAEVVTDCIVYPHYKGFSLSFWWHHVSTAACTSVFLMCQAPVGFTVSYGSAMEAGGLSLNVVSLYPSPFSFQLRTIFYSASRLVATFILSLVTYEAYQGRMAFPWWAVIPAWALMAVNWLWIARIVSGQFNRAPRKDLPSKAKGA